MQKYLLARTKEFRIHHNREMPKVRGRGRIPGVGINLELLRRMGVGDSIWDVPENLKNSIRNSAYKFGFKVMIRRIPDTKLYAIKRLT